MSDPGKIKAYQVQIVDHASGRVVQERPILQGPTDDEDAIVRHQLADGSYVAARLKTYTGDVFVTARGHHNYLRTASAAVDKDAVVDHADGRKYRVAVKLLDEAQWTAAPRVDFKPPKVTVRSDAQGYWVTFEPQQLPCVLTCAVVANGTKDEEIPSCPFPSNPRFVRGTVFIARGKYGAQDGGVLRLGVRGAGRIASLALPAPGQSVDVQPDQFRVDGAAAPKFLTEQYVVAKYNEKYQLVKYE